MPAWRMPPPTILRVRRASWTKALEPQMAEPTGAERPLEKQNCTESACAAISARRDAQGRGGVKDAGAIQMHRQAIAAGYIADGSHLRHGEHRAAADVVGILQGDGARTRHNGY